MYSHSRAAISVVLLSLASSIVASTSNNAETTSFQDWSGSFIQTAVSDGSLLNEYVAHTFSGNTQGAILSIAFAPRFSCTPMISVQFSQPSPLGKTEELKWILEIDSRDVSFPSLFDSDDTTIRFSLNGGNGIHQELRETLDAGSRASFVTAVIDAVPETSDSVVATSTTIDPVYFSLIGSKMTVQALEEQCKAHLPIPYEN